MYCLSVGIAIACTNLPVVLDQDVHEIRKLMVGFPILCESREECRCFRVWLSRDRGQTWKRYAEMPAGATAFLFASPGDGQYWFVIQTETKDGKLDPKSPIKAVEAGEIAKVYFNVRGLPVIRPQVIRHVDQEVQRLQRENKQLRATVDELRKRIGELERKQ
jgi:hypothetical protein